MSNWQQFKKNQSTADGEKPPFRPIEGVFLCQTCREVVMSADLFYTDGVVRFKCSEDHFNLIENFPVF